MSNRRTRAVTQASRLNQIRGPQSALTDFLASNNISANQIRLDHDRRRAEAEQQAAENNPPAAVANTDHAAQEQVETEKKKRKRKQDKALEKVKQTKKFKGRAKRALSADSGDDAEEENFGVDSYRKSKPLPGQLENCELCGKRFTVTGYSKAGRNGGLLCSTCSKELEGEEKRNKPKKAAVRRDKNRKLRSDRLDGMTHYGPSSLLQLCLKKVTDNINEVEDFGELPPSLMQSLSKILSKKRALNPHTLGLLLKPNYDTVEIYDGATLSSPDYQRIFMVNPKIKNLVVECAGMFKNETLQYLTNHPDVELSKLRLQAANLIDDETWRNFFAAKGRFLRDFKLDWVDGHFDDDTFAQLVVNCDKLERLKLDRMSLLTEKAIDSLVMLKNLKHLSLHYRHPVSSEAIIKVLDAIGPQLETFCLDDFCDINGTVVEAVHQKCRSLRKLRIRNNNWITDKDLTSLFTDWSNGPLTYANFDSVRNLDTHKPHLNLEGLGLCSNGFEALMRHSGEALQYLDVTSCRHISHAAFMKVFAEGVTYPRLKSICVSFCATVDDAIVAAMFRSCLNVQRIEVFACFGVKDVVVPRGVVLLGRPNAQDEVAVEGAGDDPV